MSELKRNHNNKYNKFDIMSTEDLEKILRQNSELPQDKEYDMGEILYISEVVAKREQENPTGKFTDVSDAWKSFKQDYYPIPFDGNPILDDQDKPSKITENFDTPTDNPPVEKHKHPIRLLTRAASIAAIIVVVLFAGTVTAYAMGYNLWGYVAQWSRETFNFTVTSEPSTDKASPSLGNDSTFGTMQEALDFYNIEEKLAPTWIPQGYELTQVESSETPCCLSVCSRFVSKSSEYVVSISKITNNTTLTHEKDDGSVTEYIAGNVIHYIMTNQDSISAVWANSGYECDIAGNISMEELQKIIDSIYER